MINTMAQFVLALALAGPAVEGSFDRTLNVSGTVDLEIATGSGSIAVRQGQGNRVEIHGRIRAGDWWRSNSDAERQVRELESNPPIEQSGQTIRIGRTSDRWWERGNVSISYEIVVPSQTNVRANTGSGSQTVDGLNGRVAVTTGSGSIRLRDLKGDLEATTGSGSIRATDVRGGVRMHTGSGGIEVDGEQTARWDIETGSGGIDVRLPQNAGFEISAHTGSGSINVNHPMTVRGRIDSNRHNLSGRVGSGQYALNARTGSGHIRVD